MDRRTTIKWVAAASAAWPLLRQRDARGDSPPSAPSVPSVPLAPAPVPVPALVPVSKGYGSDPNLGLDYHPGEAWALTLTAAQREQAGVLADLIIPADDRSPSATAAGVVDFIDAWVSAPYPDFQRDRGIVLGGFAWLDLEAARRFGKDFIELDPAGQLGVCDDICDETRAATALREAARFFARYRDLTAGGFYSSPIGRSDLNYIGNVPLTSFEGPPPALLKSLGLL